MRMTSKDVLLGGIEFLCAEYTHREPLEDVSNEWKVLEVRPGSAISHIVVVE
jgi:hypothetical protein